KRGPARIAREYEARRARGDEPGGRPLTLVPVGLTFEARKSFRGRVLVMFGEPVALTAYVDRYQTAPAQAVEALTTSVQVAMEAQVVNVRRLDWAALIRAVDDLYRGELVRELHEERGLALGQIDTIRLSRAIAEAAQHFAAREADRGGGRGGVARAARGAGARPRADRHDPPLARHRRSRPALRRARARPGGGAVAAHSGLSRPPVGLPGGGRGGARAAQPIAPARPSPARLPGRS